MLIRRKGVAGSKCSGRPIFIFKKMDLCSDINHAE